MTRGKLIVLEGTDGSGTTTQGDDLADHLRQLGLEVVRTAQPSPLATGQLIRQILRGELQGIDAAVVALLFAADRVDLGQRVLEPALQRGAWVVCDRHLASSLAFQVVDAARDPGQPPIDPAWITAINRCALQADLTLWLDLPVEVALQRIESRGKPLERFEVSETLQRVRDRYAKVFADPPSQLGQVAVVDGSATRDAVGRAIRQKVSQLFALPELA